MPGLHLRHVSLFGAPTIVENLPVGQDVQVRAEDAPIVEENLPAGHEMHVDCEVASEVDEYLPAGHAWQAVADSTSA